MFASNENMNTDTIASEKFALAQNLSSGNYEDKTWVDVRYYTQNRNLDL